MLLLPEDVVRTLNALLGVNPRDLIVAWVRSWENDRT
jgi:hypothetical protein